MFRFSSQIMSAVSSGKNQTMMLPSLPYYFKAKCVVSWLGAHIVRGREREREKRSHLCVWLVLWSNRKDHKAWIIFLLIHYLCMWCFYCKRVEVDLGYGWLQELQGRTIRVEFAKSMKKPPPPPPPESATVEETQHKLYVSNLAWKVRSSHLREFFAANYNPVSTRVVFDSPSGRSAGYGFISFSTKEEVDAAISTLDGKVTSVFHSSIC